MPKRWASGFRDRPEVFRACDSMTLWLVFWLLGLEASIRDLRDRASGQCSAPTPDILRDGGSVLK